MDSFRLTGVVRDDKKRRVSINSVLVGDSPLVLTAFRINPDPDQILHIPVNLLRGEIAAIESLTKAAPICVKVKGYGSAAVFVFLHCLGETVRPGEPFPAGRRSGIAL